MSLMFVARHNLNADCEACGTTVQALSEYTGIPEPILLGFAAGEIALCAHDRFAILAALVHFYDATHHTRPTEPALRDFDTISREVNSPWQLQQNEWALQALTTELEEEKRLLDSSDQTRLMRVH